MPDRDEDRPVMKYPQHILKLLYWGWLLTGDREALAAYIEAGGEQDKRTELFFADLSRGEVKGSKRNHLRDLEVHARVEEEMDKMEAEEEERNVRDACNAIEENDYQDGVKPLVKASTRIDQHRRGKAILKWFLELPENAELDHDLDAARRGMAAMMGERRSGLE